MIDFLNLIKDISDKLAATGKPHSKSNLVTYIISRLSNEYESFVDFIEIYNEFVTADELHGLLLSKEISLQKCKVRVSSLSSTPFHAYVVRSNNSSENSKKGNSRGCFQNRNQYNQNRNFGEINLTTTKTPQVAFLVLAFLDKILINFPSLVVLFNVSHVYNMVIRLLHAIISLNFHQTQLMVKFSPRHLLLQCLP